MFRRRVLKNASHPALQEESNLHKVGLILLLLQVKSPPVLKVDFFELTILQRGPEAVNPAAINASLVLVSRPIDLVKISGGKPSRPRWQFLAQELGKESVFASGIGGAVDCSDLEEHISPSQPDHGGEAVRSEGDAGHVN